MGITFDKPPLTEVSLGCTFLPRPDFQVPHFGEFWQRIKARFPDVAQAPPIVTPGDLPLMSDDGTMLPRIWYVSGDKRRLMQLQQNRFHFNWRQTNEPTEYVRFPAIQAETIDLWDIFRNYVLDVTGTAIQPLTNELTYTNLFGVKGKTAFEVADETLRDSVWCHDERFLKSPVAMAQHYTFEVPDDCGQLTVQIATVHRSTDDTGLLKIDLTARGRATDKHPLGPWSLQAHDFLVEAFKDLTTPAMHKKWRLRNA